jgi:succinoglycan biosynthesis protein ExoL
MNFAPAQRPGAVAISYFVHDTSHPDIARRVNMFREGGAGVTILGFHRGAADPALQGEVIDLGRTEDARMTQRVAAVARAIPRLGRFAAQLGASEVIVARNLEMLVLGAIARRRYAPRAALVYECLDIHRLMLGQATASRALRRLEGALLRRCDGLMTSSPGFVREYFAKLGIPLPRVFVVENKVYPRITPDAAPPLPPGPPWRIGWFGLVRCARSLAILSDLLRRAPGLLEVTVAGRPSVPVFGDAAAAFGNIPGLHFHGSFKDEAELAGLFAATHFSWLVDYFEAGANSDWLLPNRLYRAVNYGSVPIAVDGHETANWLAARGIGIRLEEPAGLALEAALRAMTPEGYLAMRGALASVPRTDLVTEEAECLRLVGEMAALRV